MKIGKSTTIEAARIATGAARKWVFYPARFLGVPVAVEMQAEITLSNAPSVNIVPGEHRSAPILK